MKFSENVRIILTEQTFGAGTPRPAGFPRPPRTRRGKIAAGIAAAGALISAPAIYNFFFGKKPGLTGSVEDARRKVVEDAKEQLQGGSDLNELREEFKRKAAETADSQFKKALKDAVENLGKSDSAALWPFAAGIGAGVAAKHYFGKKREQEQTMRRQLNKPLNTRR
jgi:hypothetical protein